MKKRMRGLVALGIALCLLLSGCRLDFAGYFQKTLEFLLGMGPTYFSEMTYNRPNPVAMKTTVDSCCEKIEEATDFDTVISLVYEAYAPVTELYTAYTLANIHYCKDLTDSYWAEEYAYCSEYVGTAQAALDRLYRVLAQSSFREELEAEEYFGAGFFEDYEGESVYDEVFTQLLSQEAALEAEYYALWNQAGDMDPYSEEFLDQFGSQMAQLYVRLIRVRQEMAAHLGYGSYPEFAYDHYYGRDYTCQEAAAYLADIRAELVPLYQQTVTGDLGLELEACTEQDMLAYVRKMANAMGGQVQEAYEAMVQYGLYDIGYGENKYEASFTAYIQGYYSPYLFINPTLSDYDKLTMAHEFGHFCCHYAAYGSGAGTDVAEVFSQGMEYLSLCYVQDSESLETLKMVSSLGVMVEQAAYASFEQRVYALEGDELTAENIQALFQQVGDAYGLGEWGFDSRSYVHITHFFTNPMYVISYVVSNDVALQLYQMELAERGTGLAAMQSAFASTHTGIVAFAQEYGLESPFADGRLTAIRETLQAVLG